MTVPVKRYGFFRRTHETPFRVLVRGKVKEMKKGEVELLEFDTFKDVWGFRFEGFPSNKPQKIVKPLNNNKNLIIEEIKDPGVSVIVDEPKEEKIEVEVVEVVDTNIVNKLKTLKKQDFFIMKKEECKEYLDNLGADYSNINDDKWSLVKFLQKIIKEL
jgi:hypothetical protein